MLFQNEGGSLFVARAHVLQIKKKIFEELILLIQLNYGKYFRGPWSPFSERKWSKSKSDRVS